MAADTIIERELTLNQRGLVDNCLEEGQFEAAISTLNQLRSHRYKPHVSHVWQLIYIALQSTSLPTALETDSAVYSSPSKSSLKRRALSADAVIAARRLLVSYIITNRPSSIARAIPSYDNHFSSMLDSPPDDLLESAIGSEAMCIPRAKNCWSMLVEGFTAYRPSIQLPSHRHARASGNQHNEALSVDTVVGHDAWPVLDWLLMLFEQDERYSEKSGSAYSPLLLQQIPLPRTESGLRWDTEIPLRIISLCLEQGVLDRQIIGIRLITLLINLAYAKQLDITMFTSSVFSSLAASGAPVFRSLLSSLGSSDSIYWFKTILCQKYLSDMISPNPRPQPQARAQPRALKGSRAEHSLSDVNELGKAEHAKKIALPPYFEIQKLLQNVKPVSTEVTALTSPPLVARIKYELLNSYGMLQGQLPPEDRDSEWILALKGGHLVSLIDTVFGVMRIEESSQTYKEVILLLICVWDP